MCSPTRQILVCALTLSLLSGTTVAQMAFDKVEIRTTYGQAEEGNKGKLLVDGQSIRFVNKKNDRDEYFSVPADAITEIFYSRVSGRRIKTAIFVSALLLFSKGKKHYLTLSFDDGAEKVGAVEFKLDKKNYRGILRAIEQVSDVELVFDQEGIKDQEETVATRGRAADTVGTLEISSEPDGADIEINDVFAGTTPRTKTVRPGEYKIKIKKKGFDDWERKIQVAAGEEIPIRASLEE